MKTKTKMNTKSNFFAAVVASTLILTGCATNSVADNPKDEPETTPPVTVDLSIYADQYEACPKVTTEIVQDCNQKQGTLKQSGLMGCYMCIVTYSDAGDSCQDASDCEGECRAVQGEFLPAGTPNQIGECQKTSSPFGCYQTIKNGVLQPALCVD